jgi:Protein of unknown function (DUF1585)
LASKAPPPPKQRGRFRRNVKIVGRFAALMCAGPLATQVALAKPSAPAIFCGELPGAPVCEGGMAQCTTCHSVAPQLNVFGVDVKAGLLATDGYSSSAFDAALPGALGAALSLDSDGDGRTNRDEILSGGDPAAADAMGVAQPALVWDPETAFRRVSVVFCGSSPSYEQVRSFASQREPSQVVHTLLSECLASDYWRNEALHRLADDKIRPLEVVGMPGSIVLADYGWDYRLFSHVMSDDRDTRDLLLADYHVTEKGEVTREIIPRQSAFQFDEKKISIGTGQPLPPERRAGMITTQWFLVMNTMFSRLPRTTASQAYRAYLGLDLAAGQGLMPVANEPRDVDGKGVAQPACAACHSTLDPLAYAFSSYNGIEVESPARSFGNIDLVFFNVLGAYDPLREPWEGEGHLFQQRIANVNAWAKLAAESDAFKQNLAHMLFTYVLRREPGANEAEAFRALWQSLPADGYSANKLLHRIVDLPPFGSR